jgi:hypothetical protein
MVASWGFSDITPLDTFASQDHGPPNNDIDPSIL